MLYQDDFLRRLETGLRRTLPRWGLPATAEVNLLTVSENATYRVRDEPGGRTMVLRVHRPGYHTREEILSELAWLAALREEGVVETPALVPTTDGSPLCAFDDDGEERHVAAFAFMSGREPDPADDLVPWFGRLGGITARLHAHSRRWRKPAGFVRKTWNYDTILGAEPHWGDWRRGIGLDAPGTAVLERTTSLLHDQLAAYGTGPERFGLIHADLRLANLLVEGDRLGVIDFDDCGLGWFAFDFAAAVSFFEHEPFVPVVKAAWVEGYRQVSPLAPADEQAIDMFLMLRRIQLTAWIASHSETPTAEQAGPTYTQGTVALAETYLGRNG